MTARPASHPFHQHELTKVDTRRIYAFCEARWCCDCCQRHLNGTLEGETTAYHCHRCEFDLCEQCYTGSLHPFHRHYLQPAKPTICYTQTGGQWRCDACQRVFSRLTSQVCYHCSRCQVDLCEECYRGQWRHVMHDEGRHTMTPIDPRIHYRCFTQWECEGCGTVKGHGEEELWTMFHCQQCDTDLCLTCFSGHKHHHHPHGLVMISHKPRGGVDPSPSCQLCSQQLVETQYFRCRDPSCQVIICQQCFRTTPPPHPLHPLHTLYRSDPSQTYPQSGGVWHCDNCTSGHPQGKQTPLCQTDPMYHCAVCQYDLCMTCYQQGQRPKRAESGGVSRQRNYLTTEEAYKRPPVSRPPVTFIPSGPPSLPAPTICRMCGLALAKLTLRHGSRQHSRALYCQHCALDAVRQRVACPLCGAPPDGVAEVIQ